MRVTQQVNDNVQWVDSRIVTTGVVLQRYIKLPDVLVAIMYHVMLAVL